MNVIRQLGFGRGVALRLRVHRRWKQPDRRARYLHRHAEEGDVRGIKLKLKREGICDVDAKNPDGNTALHIAAMHSQLEPMGLLLEAGSDPITVNKKRQIAIHCAAEAGFAEGVRLLIMKAGAAQTKVKDRKGRIPYEVAANDDVRAVLRPFTGGYDEKSGYGPGRDVFGEPESAI
ncbi:hypothetical protein AAMO2058_000448400 [Amorphochlora amoebiformis]